MLFYHILHLPLDCVSNNELILSQVIIVLDEKTLLALELEVILPTAVVCVPLIDDVIIYNVLTLDLHKTSPIRTHDKFSAYNGRDLPRNTTLCDRFCWYAF